MGKLQIEIYDGKYLVTSEGEIYSLFNKGKMKIHKQIPRKHSNGYLRVLINGKDYYIHRLVAECFLPNPYEYKEVNHKDGNKTNNCVDNLEWCSRAMNNKHCFETGLRSYDELKKMSNSPAAKEARKARRKLSDSQVREVRKMLSDGMTSREIAKILSCTHGIIDGIKYGKSYTEVE